MLSSSAATFADGAWERTESALPQQVGVLRNAIVAFAAQHGADADKQSDVALASSEALTNAVVHAFVGRTPGTITVIAKRVGTALTVRVIDDGRGMMPRLDSPGLGLGLPTIAGITASFDIRGGENGKGTEVSLVFEVPA